MTNSGARRSWPWIGPQKSGESPPRADFCLRLVPPGDYAVGGEAGPIVTARTLNGNGNMTRMRTVIFGGLMLGCGYLLGAFGAGTLEVTAQEPDVGVTEETANKIRDAHRRLTDAMEALQAQGRYEAVTEGINSFLVLSGGGNAREDLESGRGVDPETFAALYAGRALPEIQDLLDTDEQGRITYNDEVVRMYSKARLQRIFANRIQLTETGN